MDRLVSVPKIITVTPNTALDRIEIVPSLTPGKVLRSTSLTLSAGGKGVNVARAVKNLGGEAACAGFLGGNTGRQHAELVSQEGIQAAWTWIDEETRAAIVIVDAASGETTVINEEGPVVTSSDWDRFLADVLALAVEAEAVCLSGSLPQGLDAKVYTELVKALNQAGRSVWIDSSGAGLIAAVHARPSVVKVNGLEAACLLGWPEIQDVSMACKAANTIRQDGFSKVIVTLGKLGAVYASQNGIWYSRSPDVKALCPIGSGDAFLGGLVQATLERKPEPETLREAVAAGSANALSLGGGAFTRQEFHAILENTTVNKLV